MLLTIQSDHKRRDIDDLLSDSDMSLLNEHSGMVDGLGETKFIDTSLQSSLQEILDFEGEHVIELHAGFVEDTDSD